MSNKRFLFEFFVVVFFDGGFVGLHVRLLFHFIILISSCHFISGCVLVVLFLFNVHTIIWTFYGTWKITTTTSTTCEEQQSKRDCFFVVVARSKSVAEVRPRTKEDLKSKRKRKKKHCLAVRLHIIVWYIRRIEQMSKNYAQLIFSFIYPIFVVAAMDCLPVHWFLFFYVHQLCARPESHSILNILNNIMYFIYCKNCTGHGTKKKHKMRTARTLEVPLPSWNTKLREKKN